MKRYMILLVCSVFALVGCAADIDTTGVADNPAQELLHREADGAAEPASSTAVEQEPAPAGESSAATGPDSQPEEDNALDEGSTARQEPVSEAAAAADSPMIALREVQEYSAYGPTPTLEDPLILDESHVRDAQATVDEHAGAFITVEFTDEGAEIFAAVTARLAGTGYIAIWINGELISVPMVSQPITDGVAVITGGFEAEEAETLAEALRQTGR